MKTVEPSVFDKALALARYDTEHAPLSELKEIYQEEYHRYYESMDVNDLDDLYSVIQ